jgi:protein TonB
MSVLIFSCYAQEIKIKLINGYSDQPITDFKLNFVNRDGEVVDSQVSDENGIIEHKLKEPVRAWEDSELPYFKTFPLKISSQFSDKTFIHYFYPTMEAEKRIMQWEKNHPGRRVPDFSLLDDVEIEVTEKETTGEGERLDGGIPEEVIEVEEDTTKVVESEKVIVDYPDKEASFPKGVDKMKKFLAHNIQYPEISMEMGDQGKVFVQFVVEKNGLISQVKVLRGVSSAIDAETIRVVRSMPEWSPAESKGEVVRARCRIPINFILQ